MYPYERINTYRPGRGSPWRRRFSAALPWVFVLGVAAGTALPVRHWVHWPYAGGEQHQSADSPAARDAEIIWKRAGNPDVRHPVDVIRTPDRAALAGREELPPGSDVTTRAT